MNKILKYISVLCIQLLLVVTANAGEKINTNLDLGGNRAATWYLPDGQAAGWILLQHGFQRNKGHLDDMATHLMDNGFIVLTINSSVTGGNRNLALQVADDIIDNPPTPPNGITLPNQLIVAGHSAGGLFVSHVSGQLVERNFDQLKGAILFDPVDANPGMQTPLQTVVDAGIPVLSILANSGSCNSSNNALTPLRSLTDAFVGIKLTDNSKHFDVEGSSTGGLPTWICGTPQVKNTNYVKTFTTGWATDMFNGTQTPDFYPGGSLIQQLIADDDGELIKAIVTLPPSADFNYLVNDLAVTFSDNSSDSDGQIISYAWDFGDGSSSTQQNPNHTFSAAGTYTVSLTVTDNDLNEDSISKNITINDGTVGPNASFTYAQDFLNVSFTDTSSDSDGEVTAWLWDFGDGASSAEANPSHTYLQAGSYTVSLQVTDNDGLSDSFSQTINVNSDNDFLNNPSQISGLAASRGNAEYFKMNVAAGARDLRFAINGGSGDADIYIRYGAVPTTSEWDYRPYRNGNNETVNIAAPDAGVWHIMVRAYNSFSGVTLNASYQEEGNQAPIAAFSVASNELTASFTDNSNDSDGSITARLWTFGDGAQSSEQNPVHSYVSAGTYTVTLAVTDDQDATDQVSQTITVSEDGSITEIVNGEIKSNLSAADGEELMFVLKNVPPATAELRFAIEGGSGDADIYVRFGAPPTTSTYDYRPYLFGNNETVTIGNAQAGDWYVMVRAYDAFSGVNLQASHTAN
ncbi:PKD domain-containing protein [Aliikangiella marina]|nr:PKD domain-containing protein [Aliikangiella marina]